MLPGVAERLPFIVVALLAVAHLLEVLFVDLVRIGLVALENLGAQALKLLVGLAQLRVAALGAVGNLLLVFVFGLLPLAIAALLDRGDLFFMLLRGLADLFLAKLLGAHHSFLMRVARLLAGPVAGGIEFEHGLAKRLIDPGDLLP